MKPSTWIANAEVMSMRSGKKEVLSIMIVIRADGIEDITRKVDEFFTRDDLKVRVHYATNVGLNL